MELKMLECTQVTDAEIIMEHSEQGEDLEPEQLPSLYYIKFQVSI